jgi:hypothetical protein
MATGEIDFDDFPGGILFNCIDSTVFQHSGLAS